MTQHDGDGGEKVRRGRASLTVLGTSDSKGVPRWYCECDICNEAREHGLNRRTRSSVLLNVGQKKLLVDPGPDFHRQMNRVGVRHLDACIVTHAHNDHVLGLGDLMDWLRYEKRNQKHFRVYAAAPVVAAIRERFAYLWHSKATACVVPLPADGVNFQDWRIQAFEVPHGFNGNSYALRFTRRRRHFVYCTDAIDLPKITLGEHFAKLELLLLGTNNWHEETFKAKRSIYDVQEALRLVERLQPRRTLFTHLSHDINLAREHELPPNVRFARENTTLELW